MSNYPNMQQLPACVESACSAAGCGVLVTLHDAEDRVTVYRVWVLVLVVTRRWMQCSGVWWLVLH